MADQRGFSPAELLTFIELDDFRQDWRELGLDDDDLLALQVAIMRAPRKNRVVPGTGGLRKIRFSPKDLPKGKSGAFRICYVYFEELGIVLLIVAYGKNEKDDLSAAEKKAIRQYIERQKAVFSKRSVR